MNTFGPLEVVTEYAYFGVEETPTAAAEETPPTGETPSADAAGSRNGASISHFDPPDGTNRFMTAE